MFRDDNKDTTAIPTKVFIVQSLMCLTCFTLFFTLAYFSLLLFFLFLCMYVLCERVCVTRYLRDYICCGAKTWWKWRGIFNLVPIEVIKILLKWYWIKRNQFKYKNVEQFLSKACKPLTFCVGKVLIIQYDVKGAAHTYSLMLEHLK